MDFPLFRASRAVLTQDGHGNAGLWGRGFPSARQHAIAIAWHLSLLDAFFNHAAEAVLIILETP